MRWLFRGSSQDQRLLTVDSGPEFEPELDPIEQPPDEPSLLQDDPTVELEPEPDLVPLYEECPMTLAQRVRNFVDVLDWRALRRQYNGHKSNGKTPMEAADLVAAFLDQLIPFDEIIPGEVGEAVERFDGPAFRDAARVLIGVVLIFTARGVR